MEINLAGNRKKPEKFQKIRYKSRQRKRKKEVCRGGTDKSRNFAAGKGGGAHWKECCGIASWH
jgi:hypothetical protein